MRAAIPVFAVLPLLLAAGPALSPQAAWKAGIADENKDYAQIPHAMLKIQDAAYLGDGQSAVLQGVKGQPGSWRWHSEAGAQGPLRIAVTGGKLSITLNGKPLDPALAGKSIVVDKDVDVAGQPTQVAAGVNGWRFFVYNQKNPAAVNFTGVSYFPFDAKFRLTATFTPDSKLPPQIFRTSRGTSKQFYHAGEAHFSLGGKNITLPFYAEDQDPKKITELSAFYNDGLTGKGAYAAGRYVDVDGFGGFPPAKVTIDFNQAYNPNCARSAFFTCPLAQTMLPVALAAGERDPHQAH